jgi:endonuclease/exonuclease/phosphatase family metal-dependent hydrolase
VRQAQATELTATPTLTSGLAVVLLGDLNSDPTGASAAAGPAAYEIITGAGFTAAVNPNQTCCHAPDLLDPPPAMLTEQIDHIFVRPGTLGGLLEARVVGVDSADRAPSAAGLLWPSDHAGVVAEVARA